MKLDRVETFQADSGWPVLSFLEVTTGDGIVGGRELNESFCGTALSDIDSAPWRDEFYTAIPTIETGDFIPPTGPRRGIGVNEAAVRSRPPKK